MIEIFQGIKAVAEHALQLQNKAVMDSALRAIVEACQTAENTVQCPEPVPLDASKIVLGSLEGGHTVLLNGKYVKLTQGDLPASEAVKNESAGKYRIAKGAKS